MDDEEFLAGLAAVAGIRGWTLEECMRLNEMTKFSICGTANSASIVEIGVASSGDQQQALAIAQELILSRVVRRLTDDEI